MSRLTPAPISWRRIRACFVAAVVALGMLGGMGGMPAIAALIAGAADQHEVRWGAGRGHFQLVLSHDEHLPDSSMRHRHTLASRLAVLLGSATTTPTGDHVLQFERFEDVARTSRLVGIGETGVAPCVLIDRSISLPDVRTVWPGMRRGEPQCGGRSLVVHPGRSTVRLI